MTQEVYVKALRELFEGIEEGAFDNFNRISHKYTYKHLYSLFLYAKGNEEKEMLYRDMHQLVGEYNRHLIKNKIRNGEKIKVAFLVMSAAEWPAEGLYYLLEEDERFDNYIIACPWNDRNENDVLHIYKQTCDFLEQGEYRFFKTYDAQCGYLPWEKIGGIPDILVHVSSWYESIKEQYWIEALPLSCMNIYIPYSFYVADNRNHSYMKSCVYNKQIMNLVGRVYADSLINFYGYQKHQMLRGENVRYSGYAKMDFFYREHFYDDATVRQIWKIPIGVKQENVKKVIIAPHHAMRRESLIAYSTFHKNAFFWEYLAKKYEDKITFIFKPHPNLRMKSVDIGLFCSFDEYDKYICRLNEMSNVRVVQEESYLEIFDTSDAMIMDSASFLAEYMYVNKPLLFLQREEQVFNELGEKMIQGYYTASGEDYMAIECFLEEIILQGKDTKHDDRNKIWSDNLDYMGNNGCLASEYIYTDICSFL